MPSYASEASAPRSSYVPNRSSNRPALNERSPKGQNRDPADDDMAAILRLSSAESERLAAGDAKRGCRVSERRGRQPQNSALLGRRRQRGDEGLLRDLDAPHHLHSALAFFLLLE